MIARDRTRLIGRLPTFFARQAVSCQHSHFLPQNHQESGFTAGYSHKPLIILKSCLEIMRFGPGSWAESARKPPISLDFSRF